MKQAEKQDLKLRAEELVEWYTAAGLTTAKSFLFAKSVLNDCFGFSNKRITPKMVEYLVSLHDQGPPDDVDFEKVSIIKRLIDCGYACQYQKDILSSLLNVLTSGYQHSEKQANLCSKIIAEVEESEYKGYWVPTEEEKENVGILISLSKRYSDFYITQYVHGLKEHLSILNFTVYPAFLTEQKLTAIHKRSYDYIMSRLKTPFSEFKNPEFKPGEIVYHDDGRRIGLVIEGPAINNSGQLMFKLMENGDIKQVSQDSIRKKPNKKAFQ